jgi:hypothetical protein
VLEVISAKKADTSIGIACEVATRSASVVF